MHLRSGHSTQTPQTDALIRGRVQVTGGWPRQPRSHKLQQVSSRVLSEDCPPTMPDGDDHLLWRRLCMMLRDAHFEMLSHLPLFPVE